LLVVELRLVAATLLSPVRAASAARLLALLNASRF
jgi:hypothetical protein